MDQDKQPNCFKCRHFKTTYRSEQPYQCDKFAMLTKLLPSIVVFKTSGEQCKFWEPSPKQPDPR